MGCDLGKAALRQLREKHRQTQKEVADVLGLSEGSYKKLEWEGGTSLVSPHVETLANWFGVSPAELLFPEETTVPRLVEDPPGVGWGRSEEAVSPREEEARRESEAWRRQAEKAEADLAVVQAERELLRSACRDKEEIISFLRRENARLRAGDGGEA